MKQYKKIVIAFDQSYNRTGVSIGADGKLLKVTSTGFDGLKDSYLKRRFMYELAEKLIRQAKKKAHEVIIITERIRTQSQYAGRKGPQFAVKKEYIFKTAALVSAIMDAAAKFQVPVYSVDTRSWKSKIVGSSKAKVTKQGERDAKGDTVTYVQKLGIDLFLRTTRPSKKNPKGQDIYDDDAADSACMCLYGFLPKKDQLLTLLDW